MASFFWSPLGYFLLVMLPTFLFIGWVSIRLENRKTKPHHRR